MYLHGLSAVKDYLDLISTSDAEAALLASDLMIGVTSFFRDRVAWKALNLEAVRKIVAENTDLPVRVWTPASATGEEAYSIAMMLLRELDARREKTGRPGLRHGRERPGAGAGARGQVSREHHRRTCRRSTSRNISRQPRTATVSSSTRTSGRAWSSPGRTF